jgi:pimeloyl-ACP methyl ester carboxylesterase
MNDWKLSEVYEFQGRKVRYGTCGAGTPLVLIHGTPFSSYVWRRIAPWLAANRQVFYFDLLGYGQSQQDIAADVSLGVQNQVLAALLDHWQITQPDIVAHDFGATTALRCHLLNGKEYRSLTLIDPVALSPWGSAFSGHVRDHLEAFRTLPPHIHEALVRAYIRSAHCRPMAEADIVEYIRPWVGEIGQAAFYHQMALFDRRYTDEVESQYGSIRCPTSILWGEADEWIPIDSGHRLKGLIPLSRFRAVPNAGHLMQEDAPEAIVAGVLNFLNEDPVG